MSNALSQHAQLSPLDLEHVESSYKQASYGGLFYSLVRSHEPRTVVELGTYLGYSGLHMAAALRDNGLDGSRLTLIDLWDGYAYRHCSMARTEDAFRRNNLRSIPHCKIDFLNAEAGEAASRFPDSSVDFLHIDISNDGEKMAQIVPLWERKLTRHPHTLMVLEGGSPARDRVDWMIKYNKPPLRDWLESPWVCERFSWFTFEPFPSLTLLRRRP